MLEAQDINMCMTYIELTARVLAEKGIEDNKVKEAAAQLAIKSLNVLKESLSRAGANAAGIIT